MIGWRRLRRPRRIKDRWLLAALTLVFAVPAPVSALQIPELHSVPVRVASEGGEPLAGVLVRLMVEGDRTVLQRVTDPAGLATFEVPLPGVYRFAAERIGYGSFESDPMRIESVPTVPIELRMETEAIRLDELVVEADEGRCAERRSAVVRSLGALARMVGLASEPSAAEQRAAATEVARLHERTMGMLQRVVQHRPAQATYVLREVETEPVLRDENVVIGSTADTSYADTSSWPLTTADPDALAERGYLEPRPSLEELPTYHLLTPEVILSESFTLTHCFRLESDPESGWAGLGFYPIPGSEHYDVRGVVWVDTIADLPRRIDYHFTRLGEFLWDSGEWDLAQRTAFARDHQAVRAHATAIRDVMGAGGFWYRREDVHPRPNEDDFGGTLHFGRAPGSARWDVVQWRIQWPGLLGRLAYMGATDAVFTRNPGGGRCWRGRCFEVHTARTTTTLHYSRTTEILEIRDQGVPLPLLHIP